MMNYFFISRLIKTGHHTPLEMASATVEITCDRGVSHELVRHRLASFNQESTRYCNYEKAQFDNEITVIRPFFWKTNSALYSDWHRGMVNAESVYFDLLSLGATSQEARSVLPNSLKTSIIMTANMREWRHIFKLRCSKQSHPQMVQIMRPLLKEFYTRSPVIFEDIYLKYQD